MPKALLGRKLGMTQVFSEDGTVTPVTVVLAGPCTVTQVKTEEHDGYNAIQLGYGAYKAKNANKPHQGHCKKAGVELCRYLREFRIEDVASYELGQQIKADLFEVGEKIDVAGTSKGKGFAGTIKRWNFRRGPMSHGSKNHRRPASAGAMGPARVFKGKKSPGQMGGSQVTVQNLEIIRVDEEQNLLLIKGAVPGPKKGLLFIRSAKKA